MLIQIKNLESTVGKIQTPVIRSMSDLPPHILSSNALKESGWVF